MKPEEKGGLPPVVGTVALAAVLWIFTFYVQWGIFWYKISASALTLTALSFCFQSPRALHLKFDLRAAALGMASAVLLYLVFWAGKTVASMILPFAGDQIGSIYEKGEATSIWKIALLLFFVTGPCEELYWRGFLQRRLMDRFGNRQGWIIATLLYAGVHISSLNFMLIGAAGVAGAFWGAMYWRLKDLTPVIISHSIWSTVIFAILPVP
ncbi:MAG: type II CAAX endopeptidase family protein [Desulfobacterales bacterium]